MAAANCKAGDTTVAPALGGEIDTPFGVAADAAGNVYVADQSNHRIQKFDSSGNFLRAWGEEVVSAGPGNTGAPDDFEICVAPADACKAGTNGTGLAEGGEMQFPSGVAVDGAGDVYVSDQSNNRIQKFDSSGNFLRAWGEDVVSAGQHDTGTGFEICVNPAGSAPDDVCKIGATAGTALGGEMTNPIAVAADAAGDVYVSDTTNHRIQKFDTSGNFLRAWGEDVVLSGEHDTAGDGFEICVNAAGSIPDDVCKTAVTGAPALGGEMIAPRGVATDVAGDVYVGDSTNDRIQKFDAFGNFQRAWGADVVLSGEHNSGGVGLEICVNPAGSAPDDVCKAGFTSAPHLGGEMDSPYGVATDPAGSVYVGDSLHHRIQKFDPSGNFLRAWGEDVVSSGEHDTGVGFETCVNAAGSDPDDVCKIGTIVGTALGGELRFPQGVGTDSAGNLYVADQGNNRVQKFADPTLGGGGGGATTATPQPTGQRARALKKCKKKKSAKARKKCKKKANRLPL
jgi:hypothetical protein